MSLRAAFPLVIAALLAPLAAMADEPLKALILDGQNNHKNWPDTTKMMKKYLEDTKRFTVDVATTKPSGTDESYKPDFAKYAVVVSNYNGDAWPAATKQAFVDYVKGGGGFVVSCRQQRLRRLAGNNEDRPRWLRSEREKRPLRLSRCRRKASSAMKRRAAVAITARNIRFSSLCAMPTIP
jgi:hypothetical protein